MKYTDFISSILNEKLIAALPCEVVQLLGVAQLVKRERKGKKETVCPAVYISGGEAKDASFDDTYDLSGYHRSLSMSTSRLPGGYGDGVGYLKMQHRMSLVIWAKRDKVQLSPDELAVLLHLAFPQLLTTDQRPEGFNNVSFNINDVVLNPEQVFNEEFKNVDYFIGPEHVLLKCNYTIESILSQRCFNTLCGSPAA